jgi:ApeA N-terminal domain 1
MEFFAQEGRFWLPRQREHVVPGSVSYQEDGVTLNLTSSLRGPISLPGGLTGGSAALATEPFIHGRLRDGRVLTLYQASGLSWPVEGMQETWRADFLFDGSLIRDTWFTHAQMNFDYLMPWTQPPGILKSELTDEDVVIDSRPVTLAQAALGDKTKIELCTGVAGRWDHASVHADQWTTLEVTSLVKKAKTITGVLNDWVRPLQDLLVVCLGRPVRIDSLAVRPRGQATRASRLEVSCRLVQPRSAVPPRAMEVESYTAPTLLTYRNSPVPFAQLIPAWFGLYERLPDVITDLCGPYYAPFIYGGHRYASTFQSAEALAHAIVGTRQKTRPKHRARVDAVAKALAAADLDSDDRDWATHVLQGRNDKPLRELIEGLVARTGTMGTQLTRIAPHLAEEAATARARVSHPGAGGPGILRRYWIGEALVWVVRAHILAQLGIPMNDLSRRATQMTSFKNVLSGLKAGDASPRASSYPGYLHENCPVRHRTEAAASRCRNG